MSAPTVEEVTQAIDSLIVAVRKSESTSGPYHDWKAADAEAARLRDGLISLVAGSASSSRSVASEPRELLCMLCDADYPVWFAPNDLWNAVVRLPDGSDKWPFLCPTCFAKQASGRGIDSRFCLSAPDLEAGAAPPEGAPTFVELEGALRARIVYCRSCEERGDDCPLCVSDRALLSRIPKDANVG